MAARTAGIIVIGDEVLKGQVADSNVHFLAKKLHSLGIKLCKVSIIPDDIKIIAKEVAEFSIKYDQVITSGGIGPTHDDVTYEGVGAAFLQPLILNEELLSYWSWFNRDPPGSKQRESTVKMATIPRDSVIYYAHLSTSLVPEEKFPVITMNNVCILPGLPKYLRAIFNALEGSYFRNSGLTFNVRRIYLAVFEPEFAHYLNDAVKKYKDVTFGSYPKVNNPYFKTVVTMECQNEQLLEEAYSYFESKLDKDWIAVQGELLGNSWNRIKEILDADEAEALSLTQSLKRSLEILEKCLDEYRTSEIFLSFNGGKDCTVLVHLVQSLLLKRYNNLTELPKLNAVYIRTESPFKEVEDFIYETAQRYNLQLITEDGPLQKGIQKIVNSKKDFKVSILGIRRSDPCGGGLSHIQKTDKGWGNLIRVSPLLDWSYQDIWTYLRELNVPYCKLYDKGILSEDSLKEAAEECEYLCEPLSKAFGPNGLGVMMPDITGLTISRIASQLLNIFDRGDSPVRDVLIKSAINLENITGDGIKTYFILLTSLFNNIRHHSNRIISFNQIKKLQTALHHNMPYLHSKSSDINKIINSFFYTRFTSPVALKLSHLLKQWVHVNESINSDIYTFLLDNFDGLVYNKNNCLPLDESKIVEGVTLGGHFIGEFPKGIEQVILKVLYFGEDNKDDKIDVSLHIINILKELDNVTERVLLVVNNDIDGKARHLLRDRRVNVLMLAVSEVTKLLAQYTFHYRGKHNADPFVGFSCDLLSHMTNITIIVPVFQLQICAPSKSYMKSYSTSLRGCLRLCRFTLDTNSHIIPAGQFERLFALYFASVFGNDDIIPVTVRRELEQWCENKERISEKLRSISINEEVSSIEQLVINMVLHLKGEVTLDSQVVSIICKGLMEVASKLPIRPVQLDYEPLTLKLAILHATFSTFLMFINTDKILTCKRNKVSLDEDEFQELD